ncbi:hypothetical protein [Neisseria sp. Ec49-e6-T10]
MQQHTQLAQLFHNINNATNDPKIANGLSRYEVENIIKEQLSSYKKQV